MTEALCQFDFSEDKAKRNSRDIFFVLFPSLIVCMAAFALYISGFQVKEALPAFCYASLIAFAIFAIEIPLIQRRQRKIKAFIYDDRIVKRCGKCENSIRWDNIAKIKINENNKGEIIHIRLKGKDKATLWLFGLNEMEKLAGLIKSRISGNILVNTRRNRLDERITIVISAVSTIIVMIIIASFGTKAMDIFAISISLGTSLFLFLFRPLSKNGTSPKWLETVFILLMFAIGIWGLVSFLHNGFLP